MAWASQSADSRISASLIVPLEDEYMNRLHDSGWNSAAVMTSVSSSMFVGLMSTMSSRGQHGRLGDQLGTASGLLLCTH